uniref:125 kDa kinesin-related protein n=1 Tax=Aegilops tauschii TaxID=37682 RepID=R7W770_AEGTA
MEKRGGTPSPSPRSTEKSGKDLTRSGDANGGAGAGGNATPKGDKEKGVNVQVILRCRPLSDDETKGNTPVVISCNERRREVAATQVIANKQIDRTFAFDKVFGPSSKQKDLFEQSISPIVHEVLEGYNCTIFAYGQTGTGKTYTMEGGGTRKAKSGELPTDAGVIPRSVRQIFDILEAQCAEYSMKVTFLELYNEEITDLLAPDEPRFPVLPVPEDKNKKPIALMEDGKGGVFVRGLEEEVVYSAGEIYKILDKGSAKRRTAETLLNKQSSRSHSIFSITIHIKELTHESEEMIKIGKLNLVDLAGSENISRSGARDGRAREAGEINKSLLTLGRVINALVEHSGHVPYRDSKLTRLLRDSLGGKTKTCIIATISPSVNQKMMKSAVIKDLYSEIDRLKQEVFAAREKNGIYIPRERYLQEEAEKKAMTEKIEKLGVDLEARDKQLVELKELYDAQMLLSAELGEKLEKTQKDLEDTRHALHDLEEKYSEAKSTIKEKEFVIFNLQNSEKSLVDCAYNLRAELENAAADVSGLFSKIGLASQLDHLYFVMDRFHFNVMQQEDHLKEMEDDMQSFVSSKDEAIKFPLNIAAQGLKESIQNLKALHGSGITALDNLAGEIDMNSQTTFEKLNSQVQSHTSDLEKCFGVIALGADNLLNELQCSLSKQEERLAHFANKQREGHLRAVEASRSISNITVGFFHSLDVHASKLTSILEETQGVQDQQLIDLEKKFEECAANEEKQLIEKVAEMLAISNARKKKLVQTAVGGLRESAVNRTGQLQKEISTAQDFTSSVREKWGFYMEETENNYIEDTTAVDSGRSCLAEVLVECKTKTGMGAQQWKNAEDSLFSLGKGNVESVDSIVRTGREANQLLRSKLSAAVSTTLEDIDVANKALLSSIDSSLKVDHEACANIVSVLTPCHGEMTELKGAHYHKVVEITGNAGKCLEEEYLVDEPSCSTPRRREIDLPSAESIEELRTPDYDELLRSFRESRAGWKQANGDTKHLPEAQEESTSPSSVRDARVPLIARN